MFSDDFKTVRIFQMTANFLNYFKTVRIFPDNCQFPDDFKTVQNLQMTANFPDYFKTVRIFRYDYQISSWFQNCPDFSRWLPIFRIISKLSGFLQMIAHFPDDFKTRFLVLSWETVSRTSSGKFLRVKSCYPESFGFLRLWGAMLNFPWNIYSSDVPPGGLGALLLNMQNWVFLH